MAALAAAAAPFCFNTQPPEGGWVRRSAKLFGWLCFNTQPPEGGWLHTFRSTAKAVCFNTQPPEGGWEKGKEKHYSYIMFQHTAA